MNYCISYQFSGDSIEDLQNSWENIAKSFGRTYGAVRISIKKSDDSIVGEGWFYAPDYKTAFDIFEYISHQRNMASAKLSNWECIL